MANTYPGTEIEVLSFKKGDSRKLFDGIFAAGGITLSQVCNMTGLEPYTVQNWVKRKYVTSPVKKLYSKEQFARIVIINMLRESLQIESISNLIHVIGGEPDDRSDDLISDDELYHRYVDMIACDSMGEGENVVARAAAAAEGFLGVEGDKLSRILQVMFYAHTAALIKERAREILSTLD